jgi:hypothetical protein
VFSGAVRSLCQLELMDWFLYFGHSRMVGCVGRFVSKYQLFSEHLLKSVHRRLLPRAVRFTVGIIAVSTRRYIDWLAALHR